MSRKLISLFLAVLMLISMPAALAKDGSVTVTDMFDREITLTEPATRIVALTAAECEIICALGGEALLVGRGEYCNYPESILTIPSVQSGAETNIEQILALEPQVLLTSGMAQSKEFVELMEANGIQVIEARNTDIEGAYYAIRMIGAVIGKEAEAEAMVADMQAAFEEITLNSRAAGKSVYFEVSPLEYGLWTTGAGTYMDEIAAMCGLTNIFSDATGWAAVSEEQVLLRNPDFIVSISGMPEADKEIMSRAGWADISAVADGKVLVADADACSRPGPRLKEAAVSLYNFVNDIVPEPTEVPAS